MFVVFCYGFPHRKTLDGLVNLVANGIRPDLVLGAPFRRLNLRRSIFANPPKSIGLMSTAELCQRLGLEYFEGAHDSAEVFKVLSSQTPSTGLILGARILPPKVLSEFSRGVINIHPGLLPQNAGLYNIEWAINARIPQGITAHIIDENIDSGHLVARTVIGCLKKVPRIVDLRATLSDLEIQTIPELMRKALGGALPGGVGLESHTEYHPPLTRAEETRAVLSYPLYRRRYEKFLDIFLHNQSWEFAALTDVRIAKTSRA